jgi:hypothetical protein
MFHHNFVPNFKEYTFFWSQIICYLLVGTIAQSNVQPHQLQSQVDLALSCSPGSSNLFLTWTKPESSQIAGRLLNDYRFELRVRAESSAAEEPPPAVPLDPFVDAYDVTHLLPYRNYSVELLLYSSSSSSSSAGRRQVPAARDNLTCRTLPAAPRAHLRASLRVHVLPDGLSANVSWQPPASALWNGPRAGYRLRLVKLGAPPPQPQQRQRQSVSAANAHANSSQQEVCFSQRAHTQNAVKHAQLDSCERFRACHVCPDSCCVHTDVRSVRRRSFNSAS